MLELIILGAVGLTVVYWIVLAYTRSVHRENLEKSFDAGGVAGLREDFIAAGMGRYEHGLHKRLILLVFVIPVALIVAIAYVVNHS